MRNRVSVNVSASQFDAHLVIDSSVNNTSSGGVRIAKDISLAEVQTLAAEMSLKYALFRLPQGGAKCGIRLADDTPRPKRLELLREIGQRLGPIIRTGVYYPGMDMNCGPEELRAIYAGAGIEIPAPTDTSLFTALSVQNALEACYEESGGNDVWNLVVEGFGRVAGHLAGRLNSDRFRIVALSTLCGAVEDPHGFEGTRLAAVRDECGDRVIERIGGHATSREDLLTKPADVLLPGARTWSISSSLAERMRAKFIIPIANAPYADGALEILGNRGLVCLPGYLTNAGGVFGSSMRDRGMSVAEVEKTVAEAYRPMVRDILQCARRLGKTPVEIAFRAASRELEIRNAEGVASPRLPVRIGRKLKRLLPARVFSAGPKRDFVLAMTHVRRVVNELNG